MSRRLRIAVIGTGLIGASIGLALHRVRRVALVAGWDPNRKALARAKRSHAVDFSARTLADACKHADAIVLAAPLRGVLASLEDVSKLAPPGAVVVDVAATKAEVERIMRRIARTRPDMLFVAAHPLAGTASRGPSAARATLFDGTPFAYAIPQQRRMAAARAAAQEFARALGAMPVEVDARAHDAAVAATSALPQLVSSALALTVVRAANGRALGLSGPGLADTTRLAASTYAQWRDPLAANRRNVARAVRAFEASFREVAAALRLRGTAGDRRLAALFAGAARARARIERARSTAKAPRRRK